MRRLAALTALVLAGAASAQTLNERPLAWLVGTWCGTGGQGRTCERWGPMGGGVMLGTSQTRQGSRVVDWEFLRIEGDADRLVYVARPQGGTPVTFTQTAAGEQSVSFANPEHDYPKRITYARQGKVLVATISGADPDRDTRSWRLTRQGR